MKRSKIESFLVIVSGVFPLYGLFYLGWSPFNVSLIYIIETYITLFFFELKVLAKVFNGVFSWLVAGIYIIIPVVIFTTVQLLLSTVMFTTDRNQLFWGEIRNIVFSGVFSILSGILLIFIRQLVQFFYYITNESFKNAEPRIIDKDVNTLSKRILIMQFTVIFGGMIGKITYSPAIGVSILVLIQMFLSFKYYFFPKR